MQREIDEVLNGRTPDAVFILGDLSYNDIEALKDYHGLRGVPMYGVVGNHDERNALINQGITDIHMKTVKIGNYTVGGFGGSIRYKSDSFYMMHSNKESEELLNMLAHCDILLTHDKPRFEPDAGEEFPNSHSGLTGIARYIERHKPEYVFHGHLHEPYYTHFGENTLIMCLYGLEWIELSHARDIDVSEKPVVESAKPTEPICDSAETDTKPRKRILSFLSAFFRKDTSK